MLRRLPQPDVSLLDRAARCRRLAAGALPYHVVRQLEAIAAEYETRPAQSERADPPLSSRALLVKAE